MLLFYEFRMINFQIIRLARLSHKFKQKVCFTKLIKFLNTNNTMCHCIGHKLNNSQKIKNSNYMIPNKTDFAKETFPRTILSYLSFYIL